MFFLLAIDDAPQGFQWPLGATIVHKGLFHVSLLLKQKTAFFKFHYLNSLAFLLPSDNLYNIV